ncbi:MAG: HyaD/HybD family hydrogenase maturation endopeptidase [bacterium]
MKSTKKIFIIGLGNILLKDEGFGIHFVQYLKTKKWPKNCFITDNIEIIDAGTSSFDLLPLLNSKDFFIFIDVIKTKSPVGSIFRFDNNSVDLLNAREFYSLHQIGFLELINTCRLLNKNINFAIFAVVPKVIGWGMELTPLLKKKLPQAAKLIEDEILLLI